MAIRFVRFESMIVPEALVKPASSAEMGVRPFFTSSRMRSLIRMFASSAVPSVSTMPAMPGSVRVASSTESAASISMMLTSSAMSASQPNRP